MREWGVINLYQFKNPSWDVSWYAALQHGILKLYHFKNNPRKPQRVPRMRQLLIGQYFTSCLSFCSGEIVFLWWRYGWTPPARRTCQIRLEGLSMGNTWWWPGAQLFLHWSKLWWGAGTFTPALVPPGTSLGQHMVVVVFHVQQSLPKYFCISKQPSRAANRFFGRQIGHPGANAVQGWTSVCLGFLSCKRRSISLTWTV